MNTFKKTLVALTIDIPLLSGFTAFHVSYVKSNYKETPLSQLLLMVSTPPR